MADVAAKVKEIVVEKLGAGPDRVTMETSFVNDLQADSLDLVEFVMELEEQFDINIPEEDAEKIKTVGDAVKYIESATKK